MVAEISYEKSKVVVVKQQKFSPKLCSFKYCIAESQTGCFWNTATLDTLEGQLEVMLVIVEVEQIVVMIPARLAVHHPRPSTSPA